MKHTVASVVVLLLIQCMCVHANGRGQTVFLERGRRGSVPCRPIQTRQLGPEEVSAMYWYHGQQVQESLLISYFRGSIAPGNGISEGVYNIDGNFSLVIENVTDSHEGHFFYTIKPKQKARQTGTVTVAIKVSAREPFPSILGCDSIPSEPNECRASWSHDTVSPNLTCAVRHAKPAADIRWFRGFGEGDMQLVNATRTVEKVVLQEHALERDWFLINNTYTTSSTVQLSANDDDTRYRCEAYGTALGDKNGSHVTATIIIEVSPKESLPGILDCKAIPSKPTECRALISHDTASPNLTCVVRRAKPAVDVRWLRVSGELEGDMQVIDATQSVVPERALETGWFLINNTYTTSSSIQLPANDDNTRYRCEAYGTALGDKNGSHVTASIIVEVPPTTRTGTSPSFDRETMMPTTDVPHAAPIIAGVLGSALGIPGVLIIVIVVFKLTRRGRRQGRATRRPNISWASRDPENVSLLGNLTLRTCQGILKPFFDAKMKYIPTGLFAESEAEAIHTDDIFIDLELYEKGQPIAIESREQMIKLLGGKKNRRHFVVKGEAGCGKTTLARQFGFDWANNSDYLKRFSLVFVLKMKEMADSSGLIDAILRQNFPNDKKVERNELRSLIDEVRDKVLIILDGFDEISATVLNKPTEEGDISVRDVLAADSLPESYVIVTTRPHMMAQLPGVLGGMVYTVIKTTGFTQKNRNEYIKRRFKHDPDTAAELIREIETAAFLEILAKKPIMLNLLCYICSGGEKVPERITQLYDRAMDVLVSHLVKRKKIQPSERAHEWKTKLQKELGKVAFEGLMDPGGERLVFRREEFPKQTLTDGFELGLFSADTSSEICVALIHKTFQEYLAAYYLSLQEKEFIEERLLSKMDIDSIERVEYLLRFSCGMSQEVAAVIFQHVRNIKDELISDRYLRVQHLTLMLFYEAQSDSLEAGVGTRLALKYREEFAAFQYYIDSISRSASSRQESSKDPGHGLSPKVHLERLEVYLHVIKNQSEVTSILKHVNVDDLYFGLLLSDKLKEEFRELIGTISQIPVMPARTLVCIDKKESQSIDGGAGTGNQDVESILMQSLELLSGVSTDHETFQVSENCRYVCGFGLRVECDVIKSVDSFTKVTECLAACRAVYFGVLKNNLNGCLSSLSTLIPFLQYLELYDCSLKTEDLESLADLIPSAQKLHELYISGGQFTDRAVDLVVAKMKQCPKLIMLELHDTGLEPSFIVLVVRSYFPEMEPVSGNVVGQFWLQKRDPTDNPSDRPPKRRKLSKLLSNLPIIPSRRKRSESVVG